MESCMGLLPLSSTYVSQMAPFTHRDEFCLRLGFDCFLWILPPVVDGKFIDLSALWDSC